MSSDLKGFGEIAITLQVLYEMKEETWSSPQGLFHVRRSGNWLWITSPDWSMRVLFRETQDPKWKKYGLGSLATKTPLAEIKKFRGSRERFEEDMMTVKLCR